MICFILLNNLIQMFLMLILGKKSIVKEPGPYPTYSKESILKESVERSAACLTRSVSELEQLYGSTTGSTEFVIIAWKNVKKKGCPATVYVIH